MELSEVIRRISCPCLELSCSEPRLDAEEVDREAIKVAAYTLNELQDAGFESIDELLSEYEKVKVERDAAVRDWEEHPNCEVCINYTGDSAETGLPLCEDYLWHRDLRDCFEWRGPQQEETT